MQPSVDDEVQRHSQAPQQNVHYHNGKVCTGHHGGGHGGHHNNNNAANHSMYFKMLKEAYGKNKVFFWNEVLNGGIVDEIFRRFSFLSWFKCVRNNYLQRFASTVLGFATQFLPNILKPFFAGFFIPLLVFLYVNWKLLSLRIFTQLETDSSLPSVVYYSYITILVLFVLTALRGPGQFASQHNKQRTQKLIQQKPYLNNPRVNCQTCQVIRAFRTQHCPNCKQCIPKYSQHSPAFNRCIGASNELLYLNFTSTICVVQLFIIYLFMTRSPEDMATATKITIFIINYYLFWVCFVQALKMFVLNFWFNLTEHEVKAWMTQPYLIAFGKRQFFNPLDIGLINNYRQSVYALFGCQESEEQTMVITGSIIQPEQNPKKYITNWTKALYTTGADLRNHPKRRQIAMKAKQMQNMMVLQTQIMNRIRQQVLTEMRGKRPIQQINQIIMMQTQMALQKQIQRIMNNKIQIPFPEPPSKKQPQSETKAQQHDRLIQQIQNMTQDQD